VKGTSVRLLTTLIELVAVALIVAGLELVYIPLALVVAGLLLLAISWRVNR